MRRFKFHVQFRSREKAPFARTDAAKMRQRDVLLGRNRRTASNIGMPMITYGFYNLHPYVYHSHFETPPVEGSGPLWEQLPCHDKPFLFRPPLEKSDYTSLQQLANL